MEGGGGTPASSLLALLADVEASIQSVEGALLDEEEDLHATQPMLLVADVEAMFAQVQELANACLVAISAVDTDAEPEQPQLSVVDELQELEILLGQLLSKDVDKDETETADTASTTSTCSSSSVTDAANPSPRPVETKPSAKKKRSRQAVSRRRHEHRAMWDCFERSCLQSHADRHRVARLFRHEEQAKVEKCVSARLQTVATRQKEPLEVLPSPPRSCQYLTKYHQTPLPLKRRTWARMREATMAADRSRDRTSILLSVYSNDDRVSMTRLYADSWDDLQAKARYKLELANGRIEWLRETAHINADGQYTKFVSIRSFAQLRHGDILCAIQGHTYQHSPPRPPFGALSKAQTASYARASEKISLRLATESKPFPTQRKTVPLTWDCNGRPVGLE